MLVNILREYNINKIFLSCLGLWPFQCKLAKRFLPIFCFTLEISYLPFEILTLYVHRHSGQMIFECLYQMVVTLAFLVKLLNQLWYRDKFQRLYEIMEYHWNVFTNDMEVGILKNYSNIAQKFAISYSILIYFMMSMFITIPSLGPMLLDVILPLNESRPRQLAVYAEYGVDQDKYFFPIFLYISVMITVGMTIMVAVDTMHIACTAHACSLFQLIGQQIENIIKNIHAGNANQAGCANAEYELFNEKMIYQEYIVCLKKHQLALEYVDILNDTHKIVGISFSLFIAAVFSLLGVRIVYVLDQLEELIRFTFIIMGALLQLMIVCYSGQKLMDESQNIFHRAYAAEWYKFSPRLKSLLIITLYRSVVPCKLTAGNLFPLSMAIFATKRIMLVHMLREYNVNKIFLSCIGVWPFQSELVKYFLSIFCLIVELSYLRFEIITLYMHRDDRQIIFECLNQMAVTIAFLVKLLNQFWYRDKFRRLYEIMEYHWNVFTNDTEVRIMKHYSNISYKFTLFYSILIYAMVSMFITIPSFGPLFLDVILPLNESRPQQLVLFAEYGIDHNKYFYPILLYLSVTIVVGLTIMVAVDTMHIACTAHACGLFELIGTQIENIISNVNAGDVNNQTEHSGNAKCGFFNEEMIYQKYIVCLKKHQLAIEFVDILNDTHKMVGISFAFIITVLLSLFGVRIFYILDQLEELIRFTFIIMGALVQLMIICYSGQKLMDESENIFHRAYAAEWYKFSQRLKSLLIITLYRSIVPCKLTAGNIFPLSMTIFATVIRTSMSYFTAFLSLQE
ncbi:uncharacterized protein [Linepithema humile]|uniref:uncharacterized protein n=1 Tax=Linepithema humile TaxID=83485 RepID=UPI00351DFC6E